MNRFLLLACILLLSTAATAQCEEIETVGIFDFNQLDPTNVNQIGAINLYEATGPENIHYFFEVCFTPPGGQTDCYIERTYSEPSFYFDSSVPGLYQVRRGAYDSSCEPSDAVMTPQAGIIKLETLPVELSFFEAIPKTNFNLLVWRSESETGFSHYEVQKSVDGGLNWVTYDQIRGKGWGDYESQDHNPVQSTYYRLKMIDLDGSFEFSEMASVNRHYDEQPITVLRVGQNVQGRVFDLMGRYLTDSTGNLSQGVYLLESKQKINRVYVK